MYVSKILQSHFENIANLEVFIIHLAYTLGVLDLAYT